MTRPAGRTKLAATFPAGRGAARYSCGGYRDHALWKKDPKTAVFPDTLQYARQVGFAGPPGRKATEALSKYILVDMFAKSIQGMKPEDAVAWASGEMRKIYAD